MDKSKVTVFRLLFHIASTTSVAIASVWPHPKSIVESAVQISVPLVCGLRVDFLEPNIPQKVECMIRGAFERAVKNLQSKVGSPACDPAPPPVSLNLWVMDFNHTKFDPNRDPVSVESYQLSVTEQGQIQIAAGTVIAALRSAWTLIQLADSAGYIRNPVTISDQPSFSYRGIMVDTTRSLSVTQGQRHPIVRLYEIIDRMEVVKLNVLHWHLTDTDGLSFDFGNANVPYSYSPAEIKKLISYSSDRGIAVIPEIDVMGHTGTVWGVQTRILDFAPPGCPFQFNLDSTNAKTFILDTFRYLVANLFKDATVIGTGQDEVAPCGNNYHTDATSLQNNLYDIISSGGGNKGVMVWADTILDQNLSFNRSTLVAPWRIYRDGGFTRYADGVNALISRGYRALIYNENPWYVWASTSAKDLYEYNPLEGINPENVSRVLGGAVSMWEPSLADLLNQVLWPRCTTVAEVLWSGPAFTLVGGFPPDRYSTISSFISSVPPSSTVGPDCE